MCVALVGGMERLKGNYMDEARKSGIKLKVFNRAETGLMAKLGGVDAIVVFTNKVSHESKKIVMKTARNKDIPVYVHHSCGVCSLRDCLNCLNNNGDSRRFK
jgi:ABC-type uncharacterized transport system substrate-binding protein